MVNHRAFLLVLLAVFASAHSATAKSSSTCGESAECQMRSDGKDHVLLQTQGSVAMLHGHHNPNMPGGASMTEKSHNFPAKDRRYRAAVSTAMANARKLGLMKAKKMNEKQNWPSSLQNKPKSTSNLVQKQGSVVTKHVPDDGTGQAHTGQMTCDATDITCQDWYGVDFCWPQSYGACPVNCDPAAQAHCWNTTSDQMYCSNSFTCPVESTMTCDGDYITCTDSYGDYCSYDADGCGCPTCSEMSCWSYPDEDDVCGVETCSTWSEVCPVTCDGGYPKQCTETVHGMSFDYCVGQDEDCHPAAGSGGYGGYGGYGGSMTNSAAGYGV